MKNIYIVLILLIVNYLQAKVFKINLEQRGQIHDYEKKSSFLQQVSQHSIQQEIENYKNNGNLYLTKIQVGSKAELYVQFDTGSSSIVVSSSNNSYDQSKDQYSQDLHKKVSIPYVGQTIQDADLLQSYILLQNGSGIKHNIVKTDQQLNKSITQLQGIFGLALKDRNEDGEISFMEAFCKKHEVEQSVFSFYHSSRNTGSEMIIGGYNPEKLLDEKKIYYHTVKENPLSQWVFNIDEIKFNKYVIQQNLEKGVVVDTGYSKIKMNKQVYNQFIDYLKTELKINLIPFSYGINQETYIYSSSYKLPNMVIKSTDINNNIQEYEIAYTIPIKDGDGRKSMSMIQIQQGDDDFHYSIQLGSLFLKEYVSIFDLSNKRLGFSLSITSEASKFENRFKNFLSANAEIILGSLAVLIFIVIILIIANLPKNKSQDQSSLKEPFIMSDENKEPKRNSKTFDTKQVKNSTLQEPNNSNQTETENKEEQDGNKQEQPKRDSYNVGIQERNNSSISIDMDDQDFQDQVIEKKVVQNI